MMDQGQDKKTDASNARYLPAEVGCLYGLERIGDKYRAAFMVPAGPGLAVPKWRDISALAYAVLSSLYGHLVVYGLSCDAGTDLTFYDVAAQCAEDPGAAELADYQATVFEASYRAQ